jgi:hypothetical protein
MRYYFTIAPSTHQSLFKVLLKFVRSHNTQKGEGKGRGQGGEQCIGQFKMQEIGMLLWSCIADLKAKKWQQRLGQGFQ